MIEHRFDAADSILHVKPRSALEAADFATIAKAVDPQIEKTGHLAGIIIETESFPWWDSLGAMVAHFRFLRDHHRKIRKVGLVTDSKPGDVAERLASHFVAAEIRHFPAGKAPAAREWILEKPAS
jgi:hypothetical protein